jgi:hypothetical protein
MEEPGLSPLETFPGQRGFTFLVRSQNPVPISEQAQEVAAKRKLLKISSDRAFSPARI